MNSSETIRGLAGNDIDIAMQKLYIELTTRCNLKCKHCYNNSNNGKDINLSLEIVDSLLQYAVESKLSSVALSGGEALLYPHIEKVLEMCKALNIDVMLLTNGTYLCEGKYLDLLMKYTPDIQVSIDGSNKEINDKIRGEGSFAKSIDFINLLHESDYQGKIKINTVLTSYSADSYTEMMELSERLNTDMLTFSIVTNAGRAIDSNLNLTEKTFHDTVMSINEIIKDSHYDNCQGIGMKHTCSLKEVFNNTIYLQPKITAYGDVFPCQMYNNEIYKIGNLYETSVLKTILNSEVTRKFLILMLLRDSFIENCVRCSVKNICKRGCMAKADNDNGNPFNTDGCCDFYRKEFIDEMRNTKLKKGVALI